MKEWYEYASFDYEVLKNGEIVKTFRFENSAIDFAIENDCDWVRYVGVVDENNIDEESVWENPIRENIVQEKLGLVREYEEYWDKWKDGIMQTLRDNVRLINQFDYNYCLESDFDEDQNFYNEIGFKLNIVKNENGLIIYQRSKM